MKKNTSFWILSLMIVALVGCDSKAPAANSESSNLKPVSTDTKASGSNNAPEANNTASTAPKTQERGIDLGKIPADLKGDAFEYYGLGRTEPIKMSVTQNGTTEAASQTVKLTKVENGKAEFTISNEGGLSRLGEVLVSLDKEGIKVVSVNGQKADSETFELPTGLKVGKTWPFKLQSGDLKLTGSNVVKGTESVTTAVGTYKDALLVVSTATGNQGGQKVQLKSKQWLVKGRGQVKAEITNVSGKTTQSVTMSEAK
jgi:hypothetical protein